MFFESDWWTSALFDWSLANQEGKPQNNAAMLVTVFRSDQGHRLRLLLGMAQKPLVETNPYLRDSKRRELLLSTAVSTSTGIEGVHVVLPVKPRTSRETAASKKFEASDGSRH